MSNVYKDRFKHYPAVPAKVENVSDGHEIRPLCHGIRVPVVDNDLLGIVTSPVVDTSRPLVLHSIVKACDSSMAVTFWCRKSWEIRNRPDGNYK